MDVCVTPFTGGACTLLPVACTRSSRLHRTALVHVPTPSRLPHRPCPCPAPRRAEEGGRISEHTPFFPPDSSTSYAPITAVVAWLADVLRPTDESSDLMVTSGGGSGGPSSPRASPQRQSVFNQLAAQMGVLGPAASPADVHSVHRATVARGEDDVPSARLRVRAAAGCGCCDLTLPSLPLTKLPPYPHPPRPPPPPPPLLPCRRSWTATTLWCTRWHPCSTAPSPPAPTASSCWAPWAALCASSAASACR